MSVYSIYFSPTGGTKKVMKILEQAWPADTYIDLTDPAQDYSRYVFGKKDICLFGVPSYGGRVPTAALERIRKMCSDGASAVMIAVYGNRAYDDTLLELENELLSRGFTVKAGIAAVAEHSIMRQFGTGRPDSEDRKELTQWIQKIKENWEEGKEPVQVPGNEPYRLYNGVPMKPKADKNCIGCGLCAKQCPVGAIPVKDPSLTEESRCISCMRCIAICPQQARHVNWILLFAAAQKMKKVCESRKANELFL